MVKTNITKQSILNAGEFNLSHLSDLEKIEQLMTLAIDDKKAHDEKFLSDVQHVLNNLYEDVRIAMRKYNLYPSDFIKNTMNIYNSIDLLEVNYEANIHFDSEKELLDSIDIDEFIYNNVYDEYDIESNGEKSILSLVEEMNELSSKAVAFAEKSILSSILKKDKEKNVKFSQNNTITLNKLSLNIYILDKNISHYNLWEIIWDNLFSNKTEITNSSTEPLVYFKESYLKEVVDKNDSKNFDREQVLEYQPYLSNGYCFSCGEDMIENISVKYSKENLITGCPKCSRTMVE